MPHNPPPHHSSPLPFRCTRLCSVLGLTLAGIAQGHALAAEEPTLEAVVVTASRQPMKVSDTVADVSIIDREAIEAAHGSTLPELLARQPGLFATANGSPGANASVSIRGDSNRHTLVLVDGLRVGSATTGEAAWETLPLELVERVEILRGAASSLYGSDAMGGVINIITRAPEGKLLPHAALGLGSWGSYDVSGGLSGRIGDLRLAVDLGQSDSDGFSAKRPKLSGFNPDRDGFRQTRLKTNLGYEFAPGQEVGFNLLASQGRNWYDDGPNNTYADKEAQIWGFFLKNRINDRWASTVRIGRATDIYRTRNTANGNSDFRTDQDQYSWQNDITLPLGTLLAAVERLEQKVGGTTNYLVRERSINSAQLGWTARLGNHKLQANLRHDENSQFGGKTTGFLGYGYQITAAWRAYANVGTGFKAPTFNDLYWPGAGNPNLRPENSRNKEAGVAWEQGNQQASLVYFHNRITDLIAWAPDASGNWLPFNIDKARLEGWTASWQGSYGATEAGASLTLQDARDGTTNKVLPRRPEEMLTLNAAHRLGSWKIGAETQSAGKRYDDTGNSTAKRMGGYTLVNVFAQYTIDPAWRLEIRGNNLTDKDYETVWGYGTARRNLYLGLRYQPK